MPTYIITAPDGTEYEVEGNGTEQEALAELQRQLGAQPEGPQQSMASGLVDSITKGATFGLAPKITAFEAGVLGRTPEGGWFDYSKSFGERYDDALAAERAQNQKFEQENPYSSLAAEVAGGIGSGAGLLKGGITTGRALGKLGGAIGDSAAIGTSYAYGADQDLLTGDGSTIMGIPTQGALGGAVFGAAGKVAGDVIGGAYNKGRNALSYLAGSTDDVALTRANQAREAAGLTTQQLRDRVAAMGPEATALDALGKPGYALAKSAANTSPVARNTLTEFSDARMANQPYRMIDAVDAASGNVDGQSVQGLIDATDAARRPAIRGAYDAASQAGFRLPRGPIQPMQKLPEVRDAMRKAWQGRATTKFLSGNKRVSKLDFYDAVKKDLDGRAGEYARAGNQPAANRFRALAKTWRETVDSMLPGSEYVDARGLAEKLFKDIEAIEMGAEAAKGYRTRDVVKALGGVSPDRAPYVRRGWGAQKADDIYQNRGMPGNPDRYFSKPTDQAVIEKLLPRNQKEALKRTIEAERQFGRTANEIKGGSPTAQYLSDMGIVAGGAGLGEFTGAGYQEGGLAGVAAALARRGGGRAVRAFTAGKESKVAPAVAQALLSKNIDPVKFAALPNSTKQSIARALGISLVAGASPAPLEIGVYGNDPVTGSPLKPR